MTIQQNILRPLVVKEREFLEPYVTIATDDDVIIKSFDHHISILRQDAEWGGDWGRRNYSIFWNFQLLFSKCINFQELQMSDFFQMLFPIQTLQSDCSIVTITTV